MSSARTRFYRDKQNAKFLGVCSGVADYTGVDVLWVRIGFICFTLFVFPPLFFVYFLVAMLAPAKPLALYGAPEDEKFWQGVRSNPARTTRDVRAKFRDIDRRIADIEMFYTSRNQRLANEIDSLR